jgi:hypothetical protein
MEALLTERSHSEQSERLRLSLELGLLTRLDDRFQSPHFLSREQRPPSASLIMLSSKRTW